MYMYIHSSVPHILAKLNAVILQAAPRGPLARLVNSKHTPPMALELADFTREAIPGHAVKPLPTDVAVGGTTVATRKPAVLTLQMLKRLNYILREVEGGGGGSEFVC